MSGSPVNAMSFPNRRRPLRAKMKAKTSHSRSKYSRSRKVCKCGLAAVLFAGFLLAPSAEAQTQSPQTQGSQTQGPVRITLDEAIQLALQHNHNLLAMVTTIQQSEAEEITQGLRPNPTLFADWEYLPLGSPSHQNPDIYSGVSTPDYLKNNTEGDIGLSYLIERGGKRRDRLRAQKDITAQTRSLVADNGRGITFQVATLFYNAQLAESWLELAEKDVKSFQQTVDISEHQYKVGGISENDYLMI